ncbi:MAG: hypothetical protein ACRCWI_03645 [Brevinema sp.]
MQKKFFWILSVLGIITFLPSYSQNVVNISLSTQEMQNGITLFNQRRYAAAIQAFELSLSYEPRNHAAKYRLGLAYLYSGYAQNAIHIWEDLVRLGVADHQVIEQLNNLYFKIALDTGYDYENPYIFREYYNGFLQGGHDVFRTSFLEYDHERDLKYVSSVGKKQVVVLDNANKIVSKYGSRLFLPGILEMPMGIAIYSNFLYVADYKINKVFVFNRDNFATLVNSFGETGALPGQLSGPMGISVSEDGYLYIVDNGNHRIQKFLPDGTFIYDFGNQYLYRPTDIVVKDNIVYVTDIDKNKSGRLVLFDSSGNFITNVGDQFLKEPRGLFFENNTLYISDTFGYVYRYDISNKTTSTFLEGSKLLTPFDLIKDKDKILWRTDFNSEKIAIYTPLQGVYGNIDLNISQVLTDQYPYVYAVVRARNKDGSPITGLTKEEIRVTEFDLPVKDLLVSGTQTYRNKMKLSIIIDKSIAASKYTPQLEYYLKTFLSNTTGNDLMDTVLVDDEVYRTGMQTASVSKTWDFITNYESKSDIPKSWDVPIYDSITSLLNNFRNRAIVVFTAGAGNKESFAEYNMAVVKTYASQNNIPIYVINFGGKNSEVWSQLAEESLGRYFEADQNTSDILNLYSIIKNSPPLEYLIEYKAYNYSDVPNLWIDMNLNLERLGISGVTIGGYYVPQPQSSSINLQDSFFQ